MSSEFFIAETKKPAPDSKAGGLFEIWYSGLFDEVRLSETVLFNIDPIIFQSNPICGFRDIVDEKWCSVIDEMYQKESIAEKVSLLDEVFSSCHIEGDLPYFLQAAVDHIDEQRGITTVSDLLKKLGGRINHKWLHRNFVKYLGISPKKYISLQRFIYAYGHCGPKDSADLFDVALNSGYYDYNHFF